MKGEAFQAQLLLLLAFLPRWTPSIKPAKRRLGLFIAHQLLFLFQKLIGGLDVFRVLLTLLPDDRPVFVISPLRRLVESDDIDIKPEGCRAPNCGSRRVHRLGSDMLILSPSLRALGPFKAAVEDLRIRPKGTGTPRRTWSMEFTVRDAGGKARAVTASVALLPSGWPAVDDATLVLAVPEGPGSDSELTPRQQILALFSGVSFDAIEPDRGRIPARLRTWRARYGHLLRAVLRGEVKDPFLLPGSLDGYRLAAWVAPQDAPDKYEDMPVVAVQRPDQLAALFGP